MRNQDNNSSTLVLLNFFSSSKSGQYELWMKKHVFACCHFNNFFGTDGHIPKVYKIIDQIFLDYHLTKSHSNSEPIPNIMKLIRKLILYCGKVR